MQCPSLSLFLFTTIKRVLGRVGIGQVGSFLVHHYITTLRIRVGATSMKKKALDNGKPQGVTPRTGNGNIKDETCCLGRRKAIDNTACP